MVLDSDAVIEPGAVMVESFDASVADGAVPGARRPQDLAVRAHVRRVQLREQLQEVILRFKIARVPHRRYEKG